MANNFTKLLFLFFIVLISTSALNAQSPKVRKIIDKYTGDEGFTVVNISKNMLSMMKEGENVENSALFDKISGIQIIEYNAQSKNDPKVRQIHEEMDKAVPAGEFRELMSLNDKGNAVKFMAKEKNSSSSELCLISKNDIKTTLIVINGDLTLKELMTLTEEMNIFPKGVKGK
ncbi:MAG: DUF4252 domain-containing protein [Bacteroidota bacterium]